MFKNIKFVINGAILIKEMFLIQCQELFFSSDCDKEHAVEILKIYNKNAIATIVR